MCCSVQCVEYSIMHSTLFGHKYVGKGSKLKLRSTSTSRCLLCISTIRISMHMKVLGNTWEKA